MAAEADVTAEDELTFDWRPSLLADSVVAAAVDGRRERFLAGDLDLSPPDFARPGDNDFWRLCCDKPYILLS